MNRLYLKNPIFSSSVIIVKKDSIELIRIIITKEIIIIISGTAGLGGMIQITTGIETELENVTHRDLKNLIAVKYIVITKEMTRNIVTKI